MTTHPRTTAILACALLAALCQTGCKETPSAAGIRWEIERQIPGVRLERESHVKLGRFTMAIAKKIIRLAADEDDDDLRIISHIRRVDVATYRVLSLPAAGTLDVPYRFERRLAGSGWETIVRQREDDEQAWVLYLPDADGSIRSLCVVSLDSHELTVVAIEGRLDRMLAEALADDPDELFHILGT